VSDLGVGDSEVVSLTVQPADGDTVATLVATAPDGTASPVPVAGGALEAVTGSPDEYAQTWTSVDPVTYSAAGRWVLSWTVTGTGEGAEDVEVFVVASPTAGGPTWTPGRSNVAAYVPHRTLSRSLSSTVGSADEYVFTFDQTTTPPGTAVDRLIADAVARVSARVSPMQAGMHALARAVASLMAAVWVERSWPQDDQALQRANDMEKQANLMLADLASANAAEGETGEYGIDVVPYWSFPAADPRYDDASYW
jgi:hypothetical protein